MKKLEVKLTDDQYRRIAIVAALLHTKPEALLIGVTLGELDSGSDDWCEMEHALDAAVTKYGESGRAFDPDHGLRDTPIELTASTRRLLAAKRAALAMGVRYE